MERKKHKIEKIKGINNNSLQEQEELMSIDPYDIFFTSPLSIKNVSTNNENINSDIKYRENIISNNISPIKNDKNQVNKQNKNNADMFFSSSNIYKTHSKHSINLQKKYFDNIKRIYKYLKKKEKFSKKIFADTKANHNIKNDLKLIDDNSLVNKNYNLTQNIESDLLASLVDTNEKTKIENPYIPQVINRLRFYSTEDFYFSPIGMFKFPYTQDIKYEETNMFKKTHELFLNSLTHLYKILNIDFVLKFKKDLLFYKSNCKILKTTLGLQKIFDSNDIQYIKQNNYLYLSNVNISLAMDLIINEPLKSSYILPFIICKEKFINGMYYEIIIKKNKKVVRFEDELIYSFDIFGPFCSNEFKEYFQYRHKIFD